MSESKSASGEASSKRDGFDGKNNTWHVGDEKLRPSLRIHPISNKNLQSGFQNGKTDGEIKGKEEGEQIGF